MLTNFKNSKSDPIIQSLKLAARIFMFHVLFECRKMKLEILLHVRKWLVSQTF
jgi:hypothetical protein